MRALTLRQPWAHAVVHLGKNIENRTWPPSDGMIGAYIAIHAGSGIDRDGFEELGLDRAEVDRGAIVGVARIVRVVTKSSNRWFFGPFGWVLEDIRPLRRPIPCNGMLGLWRVERRHVGAIQREFPDLRGVKGVKASFFRRGN